ncbi:methyl-accepting chemotaxis protein [Desulfitobacterium sp. Sab5]|uniref:methyl-accepting chemotaxis protein n=1 Tax=Desulfitobacterium nosdiversum TaxID=3375356 RepID=UPI003CEBB5F9
MKVRSRLLLGNLLIALLLCITSIAGIFGMRFLYSNSHHLVDNTMQSVIALRELQFYFAGQSNDIRGFLLTGDDSYVKEIETKKVEAQKRFDFIKSVMVDEKEKSILKKVEDNYTKFTNYNLQIVDLYHQAKITEANAICFNEARAARKDTDSLFTDLGNYEESIKIREANRNAVLYKQLSSGSIAFLILAYLAATYVSFSSARKVTEPLKNITEYSKALANGDLSRDIKPHNAKDELGELTRNFVVMLDSLKVLVSQIKESATQVAVTSEELTASTEEHAKATEQVANVAEDVSHNSNLQSQAINISTISMNEISNQVKRITDSSNSVVELSQKTDKMSKEGMLAVTGVIAQMDKIANSSAFVIKSIKDLEESSHKIFSITNVITSIADQTNLLALNAAIEAVRAGEHGKGFAVVAEEVRKLAEQSKQSADDISSLIKETEKNLIEASTAMDAEAENVKTGIEKVHVSGKAFDNISNLIDELTKEIELLSSVMIKISNETGNVVVSLNKVNNTSLEVTDQMQSVSATVQEQTASIEEISAASQSLSEMADHLIGAVNKFKL